jgi:hypothetical protein
MVLIASISAQSDDEFTIDGNMVSPGNVIAQSMLDRSRIALCMMMLAVFAFNPFGQFLSHADSAVSHYNKPSGRVILEAGKCFFFFFPLLLLLSLLAFMRSPSVHHHLLIFL